MRKLHRVILAGALLLTVQGSSAGTVEQSKSKAKITIATNSIIKNSIVKIFTVANEVDFSEPWSSHVVEFSGSGCIISGQRILTNAHVVTDSTYVEVLKNGEIKRYEAEVLSIAHESDLALITIKDKSFFDDTKSLEIGQLPQLQKEVNVYGFPMGGDTLSITKGVVSRIEHQNYVHSGKSLLAIQIDAAINAGNSGGPALSDGKIVGLVMQGNFYAENMGYIIPTSVINHYLEDMKDKKYDGYPFLGMITQPIESPVMKDMYGLKDKKYGVLINRTIPNSPVSRVLKTGDILIAVDGYRVFSNQKIEFRDKEFTDLAYVLDQHQMGDRVEFTILRDAKEQKLFVILDKKSNELSLVKQRIPETNLTYFIYGGLVFVPGIREYSYSIPSKYYTQYPDEKREELVLLKRMLSSSLTKGYHRDELSVIESINGQKFKNFRAFVKLLENSQEKFIVLEDEEHYQMVLNREEVLAKEQEILGRYNIKVKKSDDLKASSGGKVVLTTKTPKVKL
jgi:S1-C subfamily serine protease